MVAVEGLGNRLDACGPQLQHEVLRAGDAAEDDRPRWNVFRHNAAPHAPYDLALYWKRLRRGATGENNRVRASQRMQRLAQAPSRKQFVGCVLWRYQNNVEVAGQRTVLKAVVQQMKLRSEFLFSKLSCFIAIFTHNHRHLELARNQKWFVAELLRQSCGIDQPHTLGTSPVPSRQHVELDAARLEQLTEQHHEWRLP